MLWAAMRAEKVWLRGQAWRHGFSHMIQKHTYNYPLQRLKTIISQSYMSSWYWSCNKKTHQTDIIQIIQIIQKITNPYISIPTSKELEFWNSLELLGTQQQSQHSGGLPQFSIFKEKSRLQLHVLWGALAMAPMAPLQPSKLLIDKHNHVRNMRIHMNCGIEWYIVSYICNILYILYIYICIYICIYIYMYIYIYVYIYVYIYMAKSQEDGLCVVAIPEYESKNACISSY